MFLFKKNTGLSVLVLSAFLLISCGSDDDSSSNVETDQDRIDKSTMVWEKAITGDKYGADVSIPHGGESLTFDETNRDVYSTQANSDAVEVGTVITKRTYKKNTDGINGDLLTTFAMIKREVGFWTDGGDWEYFAMPNNGSTDYTSMPNGELANAAKSGKVSGCMGCHSKAPGGNFLFLK